MHIKDSTKIKILNSRIFTNSAFINFAYCLFSCSRIKKAVPQCKKTNLKNLPPRNSNTLVIVGAGNSINELSLDEWKKLSNYDVAGVSYSCLLPISFRYFFYEHPREERIFQEHKSILHPKIKEKSRSGEILCVINKCSSRKASKFVEANVNASIFIPSVNVPLTSKKTLSKFIFLAKTFGLSDRCMAQYRGSISGIALLAHFLGYTKLIFAGVDLNGSPYFFEDRGRWPNLLKLNNPLSLEGNKNPYETHPTSDSTVQPSIIEGLKAIMSTTGCEIQTTSHTSLLAECFPVWSADKKSA